jgi:3-hydroxyisobutyrate dehydrogenase-like beta-hydroxyacid dehydrogenase
MGESGRVIGFVGLGLMGQGFTRRLLATGHGVVGFDRVAGKIEAAAAAGLEPAASAGAVAAAAEQIHVCVMTREDLEAAIFGVDGVASGGGAGKILVDHSTTPVEVTRAFAERLKAEAGMDWIDAPVSGGPPAAEAGTLAIMAGGEDVALARAMPVLRDLGECTAMGGIGAGQVTKMVNQVLVLNNFCILAEALALAEAGGIDAAKLPAALGQGYAGSNMLEKLFPRMLARDFAPAGYAFQTLKDLDMVQDLAKRLKVPTPMAGQAATLFRILVGKGHGELDAISVLKLYDQAERL